MYVYDPSPRTRYYNHRKIIDWKPTYNRYIYFRCLERVAYQCPQKYVQEANVGGRNDYRELTTQSVLVIESDKL